MIMKLWALWALAGTVSGLLPVIVPLNDDANGTQWGPVTADISANRCRAFAVDFEGGKRCINQTSQHFCKRDHPMAAIRRSYL